jgi:hypothetical protein
MEKECAPIRQRLAVVDDLLAANKAQLERLLDLYLTGDFTKEMLTDRRVRQEKTIHALEQERASLTAHLDTHVLTPQQIKTIQEFAARARKDLSVMDEGFEAKRSIVEALDVEATLVVEDGKKVIYVRCMLGEEVCGSRTVPLVVTDNKKARHPGAADPAGECPAVAQ